MERFVLVNDESGMHMYFYPVTHDIKKKLAALACQPICTKDVCRPHITCLVCKYRKVYYGKMPHVIPIRVLMICIHTNRRFARIKDAIIKRLAELMELVAT